MPKIRPLAPWDEAEALLEDERRMLAAVEASEEDAKDEVTWEAADKVFGIMSQISEPSEEVILGYRAVEEDLLAIQDLDAATRRLDLDKEEMLAEPYTFVDRSGWYKAPFRTAVKVAKHCCRRFPREVLGRIQKDEDELRQELVSGNLDVRESWWIDSARHREYAEERLRARACSCAHQTVVRSGSLRRVRSGARPAGGGGPVAQPGAGDCVVAEE